MSTNIINLKTNHNTATHSETSEVTPLTKQTKLTHSEEKVPVLALATQQSANSFEHLNLPKKLIAAMTAMQYTSLTPIQAAVLPHALAGKDILGSSQTGSGKTAAFGIPLIAKLLNSATGSALVLAPTRELAQQVMDTLRKLCGRESSIKAALLIGGESMFRQFQQLKMNPRLIVGTPGRINDHLERRSLKLNTTDFLVLDEADRMLDMGFDVQLEQIASHLPAQRQTLMFSATFEKNILKLADKYLIEPERIAIGSTSKPATKIKQTVVHTTEANKYNDLLKEIEQREGSIIVFVKTKIGADKLSQRLRKNNHGAEAIHGDLHQRARTRVVKDFREKRHRIMVATDVAARGLDIPHIEHVINYDLPQCPEDYIHRIGRTARAEAEGCAVSLVAPEDGKRWSAIDRLINPQNSGRRKENRPRNNNARRKPAIFKKRASNNVRKRFA